MNLYQTQSKRLVAKEQLKDAPSAQHLQGTY